MASGTSSSNHVYIKSEEHGWIPARLLDSSHEKATVSVGVYKSQQDMITEAGATSQKNLVTIDLKEYQPSGTLPLQNVDEDGKLKAVADLVDLDFLHEAAILYNLKVRHKHSQPYTRTGELIIAVNPFQWFHHLYSEQLRIDYANALVWDTDQHSSGGETVEPHVYETSCQAYRGLAMGENQSILVSGESGAGKTETVKILLSDIASVQARTSSVTEYQKSDIVQRVLDSNPLLEAFGNAKTVRNDNSSRFGKFIQLQFEVEDARQAAYRGRSLPSCLMVGSECEVYLLEKIRVVNHEIEERTYHIFYQLLASPYKGKFWHGLEGATTESFPMLAIPTPIPLKEYRTRYDSNTPSTRWRW
jgi:myosin V